MSINTDLLRRARELGINLSAVLEQALTELIRQRQREKWLAENKKAIDRYNSRVSKSGVFSDGLRRF